ncbi:glutamate ABC transporter substrate-binding protein [Kitasatospora sp. NBC_00374]|uniref:glutamate ABC transporter substrate-binding protein n=1 Tax=Kitasatospora sp. NBC_00374 TaxID=2975964 RepID=UPI0030DEE52B
MTVRRVVALAAAVVCATSVITACGSGAAPLPSDTGPAGSLLSKAPVGKNLPASPTLDRIRRNGHLTAGASDTSPGFSEKNPLTDDYQGFESDLTQLLAKYLLGKPAVEHVGVTADTREALLQNNTVDVVISTYLITPERLKKVSFGGPYMNLGQALLVRKGTTGIAGVNDLNGRKVITTAGPAVEALKKAAPNAEPVVFQTVSQCLQALHDGRGDAFVNNQAVAIAQAKKDPALEMLSFTYGASMYGVGLPKDDPAFTRIVNDFFTEIEQDGLWKQAWEDNVTPLTKAPAPTPPPVGDLGITPAPAPSASS